MLRGLRFGLLLVVFFLTLGLVVAAGRPETGVVEDAILVAAAVGLLALAVPVHRIGASASR